MALYDPNEFPETVETTTDFTLADVLAWARTKPADEVYPYYDIRGCAMFQFLKERGLPVRFAGGGGVWCDTNGYQHDARIPFAALADVPHTFGAFADRLEKALGR